MKPLLRTAGFGLIILFMLACTAESKQRAEEITDNMSNTTEQTTLPQPVNDFVAAVNRGDGAAFLSFFDEKEGRVDDWGRIYTGHAAIKAWSDKEFIGAKGVMSPTKVETDGDKISVWAGWKSNYYSGDSKFIFTVEGKQIKEMKIVSAK